MPSGESRTDRQLKSCVIFLNRVSEMSTTYYCWPNYCWVCSSKNSAEVDCSQALQGPQILAIAPPSSALYTQSIQWLSTISSSVVTAETKIDIGVTKIEIFGRPLLLFATRLVIGRISSNFCMLVPIHLSVYACSYIWLSIVECANNAVEIRCLSKLGTLL